MNRTTPVKLHRHGQYRSLKRVVFSVLAAAALLLVGDVNAADHGPANPGVVPINARFGGLTYGEWSARAFQWVFSLSDPSTNPGLPGNEANIAEGQSGNLWFLVDFFVSNVLDL